MSRHAPVGPPLTRLYFIGGMVAFMMLEIWIVGYLAQAPDSALFIAPGTLLKMCCPTAASPCLLWAVQNSLAPPAPII
jgi:hypothetical protein